MADQSCLSEVEAERRRLAQLVDDHLVRSLNLLMSQVNAYKLTLSTGPQTQMAFSLLASLTYQTLQQAIDLKDALNPSILETLGLEPALESLTSQFARRSGLPIELVIQRLSQRPPYSVELALFRTVQQLLNYAMEHHANRARVSLVSSSDAISLTFEDNSLDTDRRTLEIMVRPLREHRATIHITTGSSDGLIVHIELPNEAESGLTARELDVLRLIADGMSNKEIAAILHITARTVSFHLDNVFSKCAVSTRTEAVVYAIKHGWLSLPG